MTLEITRGDDETLTILVTDPDSTPTANAPVDLTGSTLIWMVKRRPNDADVDAMLTKTTSAGITLSNQTTDTGEATVDITSTETEELAPGKVHWELQSVDSGLKVATLAKGNLVIKADLIRA